MYRVELIIQDGPAGCGSRIAKGIEKLAAATLGCASVRVAMAYATLSGCRDLCQHLKASVPLWARARKQWLLSIDFGRTDPDAIKLLGGLQNSEVKLANCRVVLDRKLIPKYCFHPKTYVFESKDGAAFGLFVGSANLTLSGLHTGSEHATAHLWLPVLTAEENAELARVKAGLSWWDGAWATATKPDAAIMKEYTALRSTVLSEDDAESVRPLATRGVQVIAVRAGLAWANAKYLWVETYELYKNLGKNRPGNQLDLRRGTRVYFGFSARVVKPNTSFGNVSLQFVGHPEVEKNVRFANNSMDKINLPIPGQEGPKTYDHGVVLFERIGPRRFRVQLGNSREQKEWRAKSEQQGLVYQMAGGRTFGFFS